MKFTPLAGIETCLPLFKQLNTCKEMKFTPLAGIETLNAPNIVERIEMKFTPLAGIETFTDPIFNEVPPNEIHTPCGD